MPDVEVQVGDQVLWLRPSTACWSNGCFDGPRPDPLESAGTSDHVSIRFPKPAWEFSAVLTQDLGACQPRQLSADLTSNRDGTWELAQQGPAGTWAVDVFGYGDWDGDVAASFAWQTTGDGALPPARNALIALADYDGEVESYGIEFTVLGLPTTPVDATATLTVRDHSGGEFVTEIPRRGDATTCGPSAGSLWFAFADDSTQKQADELVAALGEGPFTYQIDLVLDDVTHVGTGTWPAGAAEQSLEVPLDFTPVLPAWDGG